MTDRDYPRAIFVEQCGRGFSVELDYRCRVETTMASTFRIACQIATAHLRPEWDNAGSRA